MKEPAKAISSLPYPNSYSPYSILITPSGFGTCTFCHVAPNSSFRQKISWRHDPNRQYAANFFFFLSKDIFIRKKNKDVKKFLFIEKVSNKMACNVLRIIFSIQMDQFLNWNNQPINPMIQHPKTFERQCTHVFM